MRNLEETVTRLIETLHRFHRHRIPRLIADIPRAAFVMLSDIMAYTKDGRDAIPVSLLAARCGISKAGVSQALNTLEKKGYIERSTDSRDRRAVLVRLTGEGHDMMEHAQRILNSMLERVICTFGEQRVRQLCDLMDEFSAAQREVVEKWHDEEFTGEEERCVNTSVI